MTNKTNHRAITIDQLPIPQSRAEKYCDFLVGRSTDLAALPVPQSRLEEFLEFLCYNGGIGGGTGGMTEQEVLALISSLLKDVSFDVATKQLTFFKEDGSTKVVDLSSLVLKTEIDPFFKNATFSEATNTLSFEKENGQTVDVDLSPLTNISWNNLEHAFEYTHINLMNYNEKVTGYSYLGSGDTYRVDNDWSVFFLDVQAGEQYTVYRKQDDNSRYIFTDSVGGRKLNAATVNTKYPSDEYVGTSFTVPNTPVGISKVAIQFNHNQNTIKDIMVFEGVVNRIDGFVPYTDKKSIQIEKEVSLEFDGTGTDLKSQTIHSAIIEVNNKIPKEDDNKVFNVDDNSWDAAYFRIPSLLRTNSGTLLAFSDIRYNTARDQSLIDIGVARSVNEGESWDYQIALESNKTTSVSRVMDSTSLVTKTGRIILLGGGWEVDTSNWETQNGMPDDDWNPFITISDNDGETWSHKISLKSTEPTACLNQPQGTVAWLGGVGNGIQMSDNTLVFPIQIVYFQTVNNGVGSGKVTRCGLIYSKDNGDTWTMCNNFVVGTENMIVEVNGSLIMNARNGTRRASYITSDLGTTWEEYEPLHNQISNNAYGCQGSFIAFDTINGHRVGLISTPKNLNNNYTRDNITIYMIDFDNTDAGIRELLVPYPFTGNASGAGYSSMAYGKTKEGQRKLDIIYEDNGSISHQDITFLLSEIEDIISQSVSNASWSDLDYVEVVKPFVNLYNQTTTTKISGTGAFNSNGGVGTGTQWTRVIIPIEGGKSYHICSKRSETNNTPGNILGSSDFVYFQTNNNTFDPTTRIDSDRITSTTQMNGKSIITFTTPTEATHVGFNLNTSGWTDAETELMVWESTQPMPSDYVADKIDESITIDGSKVVTTFQSTSGLTSITVKDALDELNNKIGSSNGGGLLSINGELGENGNVVISMVESTDKVSLNVENKEVSSIQIATSDDIQNILDSLG